MYCLGIGAPVMFILAHICAFRRRLITGGNLHSMERMQVGWGVGEGFVGSSAHMGTFRGGRESFRYSGVDWIPLRFQQCVTVTL